MALPYPQEDPHSTAGIVWAKAFSEAFPENGVHPLTLTLWFSNAIEAGYLASEHGRPLHEDTEPPSA